MECFRPMVDYWVSGQKINEFTSYVKYGLVDMLNVELDYNDKTMLLRKMKNYLISTWKVHSHIRCLLILKRKNSNICKEFIQRWF